MRLCGFNGPPSLSVRSLRTFNHFFGIMEGLPNPERP